MEHKGTNEPKRVYGKAAAVQDRELGMTAILGALPLFITHPSFPLSVFNSFSFSQRLKNLQIENQHRKLLR